MQMVSDHAHHGSRIEAGGLVMNENLDQLPRDCDRISEDVRIEVSAGTEFASAFPGSIFSFDQQALSVPPCSRVTVTFNNRDEVRHQWMIHGLPRYLYPGGMFHLEANGGATVSGGFIVPSDNHTYLVHCDLPQHMEKGMKAQLIVGAGSGDLWSVPGVSAHPEPDNYLAGNASVWIAVAAVAGFLITRLIARPWPD
jgi:hypothetical protein